TSAMHVVTEIDAETGALFARNPFRTDFPASVAFADVDKRPSAKSADRTLFLGRHGSLAAPAALGSRDLPSAIGAALDPCAAIQVPLAIAPGEHTEVLFLLGEADGPDHARDLVRRYRAKGCAPAALKGATQRWNDLLEVVQIATP